MSLARLAGRIMLLDGWRRLCLAFLAGLVATLALAPINFAVVGFVSFPVLVWLLDGASPTPGAGLLRRAMPAFRIGWCFGFGYFAGGLWWLGAAVLADGTDFLWALPFAVLGLPAVLAFYHAFAAACARLFWSDGPGRIAALAASLAGFEFLRGVLFTGFPWNEIGVMAVPAPLLMGSTAFVGLHGLTLGTVFVFCLPALIVGTTRGRMLSVGIGVLLLALHLGVGAWRIMSAPVETVPGIAIDIVQPDILQSQKWDAAEAERIFATLLDLTARGGGAALPEGTRRLVVWPESAFPFLLTQRPDAVERLAASLGPNDTLLAGAARVEETGGEERFYNSITVIGEDGSIRDARDKIHLVPFGEYLPFQRLLESIGMRQLTQVIGGFSPGHERSPVDLGVGVSFLPMICYEIIFQDEIDLPANASSPGFILNVTNDAWYGRTPGPYQHLKHAQITAATFGLPLVRAANTGISVVTDAAGMPVAGLALGAQGVVRSALPQAGGTTFFRRFGNVLFFAGLMLAALSGIAASVRFSRLD